MMIILLVVFLSFIIIAIGLATVNDLLPIFFCDRLGWHIAPDRQFFDGCSLVGICPRCGKKVLQDSQGNWF